ncbi:MAG: hypothetical protein ACQESR_28150, partial [Planctomycetota bacterium]
IFLSSNLPVFKSSCLQIFLSSNLSVFKSFCPRIFLSSNLPVVPYRAKCKLMAGDMAPVELAATRV